MSGKKGVTMMILVTTIIIMSLLLGVIVANISKIDDEAAARKFLTEISMVEAKILNEQYNAGTMASYPFKGTELTLQTTINVDGTDYPHGAGKWYRLSQKDLENLGLRDITGPYIVNYTTGEVVSIKGVKIFDGKYHTYDEVKKIVNFE